MSMLSWIALELGRAYATSVMGNASKLHSSSIRDLQKIIRPPDGGRARGPGMPGTYSSSDARVLENGI